MPDRWPVIDTHFHIGVSGTVTFLAEEELIPWMDKAGIDLQFVFQQNEGYTHKTPDWNPFIGNDYVARIQGMYPERVRGLATVNPYYRPSALLVAIAPRGAAIRPSGAERDSRGTRTVHRGPRAPRPQDASAPTWLSGQFPAVDLADDGTPHPVAATVEPEAVGRHPRWGRKSRTTHPKPSAISLVISPNCSSSTSTPVHLGWLHSCRSVGAIR